MRVILEPDVFVAKEEEGLMVKLLYLVLNKERARFILK